MPNKNKLILLLLFLLGIRTLFGFSQPLFAPDELQTYLIGLKFYCAGSWPYFGPDLIVTETGFYAQIPGALEPLTVGLPLYLLPIPEAPILFLNLLSFSAIVFLSVYISRRLPRIPFWFILAWSSLLPWTLFESTRIYNPSYLLLGGTLFFIGFMESMPSLSIQWIRPSWAFGLMGFGLFWCMQFHFSWILLPPFVALAFGERLRKKGGGWAVGLAGFALGAAPMAALLIPTLAKFGWRRVLGGGGTSQFFCLQNMEAVLTILARYLSFACYEILRFLGSGSAKPEFFKSAPWLVPPGFLLIAIGFLQPFLLLGFGWVLWKKGQKPIVLLTYGTFLLIYVSFWFTSKDPLAHIYYVLLPVVLVYSFYVWNELAERRFFRVLGLVCLLASLWFAVGTLVKNMRDPSALYSNRSLVAKAVAEKNYHLLGERRPGSFN